MSELFGHKKCRDGCGSVIAFSTSERAFNGTLRPLNIDGTRHTCNSDYGRLEAEFKNKILDDNGWIEQSEHYLQEVNRHLKDCTLKLVREPKHGQQHL